MNTEQLQRVGWRKREREKETEMETDGGKVE